MSDVVEINVTVSDDSIISKVEIYIDDQLVHVEYPGTNNANITYVWNTTEYTDGYHNVTVVSYDEHGNTASDTKEYYVANTVPIDEPNILVPIATILGMITAYYYTIRKKRILP